MSFPLLPSDYPAPYKPPARVLEMVGSNQCKLFREIRYAPAMGKYRIVLPVQLSRTGRRKVDSIGAGKFDSVEAAFRQVCNVYRKALILEIDP